MPKAIKVGNRRIQLDNIAYIKSNSDGSAFVVYPALSEVDDMSFMLEKEEAKQFLEMYDAVMGTIEYKKKETSDVG